MNSSPPLRVHLIELDIPFGSMVILMVKWMLATLIASFMLGSLLMVFGFLVAIALGAFGIVLGLSN